MKALSASLALAAALAFSAPAYAAVQEFGPDNARFTLDVPDGWTATAKEVGVQLTKNDGSTSFQVDVYPTGGRPGQEIADTLAKTLGYACEKNQDGSWLLKGEEDGTRIAVVVLVDEKEGKFMSVTMGGSDGDGMKQILGTLKDVPAK